MSIQDDYFDLSYSLEGEDLKALERIWFAFCDMETLEMVRTLDISHEDYLAWRDTRLKEINTK